MRGAHRAVWPLIRFLPVLVGLLLCTWTLAGEAQRPNILLILADDLGSNDIGSWGDGVAPTPTLDRLSQQSIRFRRHYADSTCSVSRAALLTGRAPVNVGFEPDGLGLSPDLATLPRSLKALGYTTHHIGKWHVGEGMEYPGVWPLKQGFDDWFGMFNHFVLRGPGVDGQWARQAPTYIDPWLQDNSQSPRQYKGHLDDLLTDRAITAIERSQGREPWFINLWLMAPHHPFEPSAKFKQKYPDTEQGHYLALLAQLDSNVGRVLRALESSGQRESTIVVFASDNGSPNLGRDSNWPLQGIKTTYQEGGVRVPMLIHWPGHAQDGDISAITHATDLYPTLLGMVGEAAPAGLDGVDLRPHMEGRSGLADRELYWAADVKNWGMSYAAYLPQIGGFYRNLFSALDAVPISGARIAGARTVWRSQFSRHQASNLIRDWERRVRPVPLQWHPGRDGAYGYLSGRDFQRTPAFGSYSLGLAVQSVGRARERQTLIEQAGVWRLALDESGRLSFQHNGSRVEGPVPRWLGGCNSLVVSLNIRPASAHPYEAADEAVLSVYLNGESILSSQQALYRPASEAVFAHPTYIGIAPDGTARFAGRLGRPVLVGKYLLPEQEGYGLTDMDAAVCPSSEGD